jgi:hypothetical protein
MKNKKGVLNKLEKVQNMVISMNYFFNTRNYDQATILLENMKIALKELEEAVDVEEDFYLNRY